MNNFKTILQEQQKALTADIKKLIEEVEAKEVELQALKDIKSKSPKYFAVD